MTNKSVNLDVEVIKETEEQLVVRANKPLKENEFNLLSQLVKKQEEESGVKIVLLPQSAELVNVEEIEAEKEALEKLKAEVQAEKEAAEKAKAEVEAEREALEKAKAEAKKESAKKDKKEKEKEADK
ncbi:hypothetical protein [Ornithinibacillus xuwenensis]|uniref:Uncharacterized protein n=1 Tax=Ornithinibacillus xuwenensis TaxID=3144668 RepID=A0ABU9XBN4_9BACI